ncbi:unnamed protein product [Calicophoron daubneyi]|uniref:Uncharacterized protein n=1 Tax=Calicophoron daubneyi TaxID=300641 RepID=A0AAV2T739_CALDB
MFSLFLNFTPLLSFTGSQLRFMPMQLTYSSNCNLPPLGLRAFISIRLSVCWPAFQFRFLIIYLCSGHHHTHCLLTVLRLLFSGAPDHFHSFIQYALVNRF